MDEVKVLEGYRVTIPREAREKLMIKRGDTLKLEIRGRKIILQSNKIPESPTMRMLGLASGYDKSPEEAMAEEVDDKLARE